MFSGRWAGLSAVALMTMILVPAVAAEVPTSERLTQQALAPSTVGARAVIGHLDDSLLDLMRDAKHLGYDGRYARIEPVIRQTFDVPYMTRVAVGAGWSGLSPDQQQALSEAFAQFIAATYASRFDGWSGERFETKGDSPTSIGAVVETALVKSDGEPIALNYAMRQTDGRWQAVDVFLTGTISELATRRSEFGAVFRRAGYQGLLDSLHQKVTQLQVAARG